MKRVILLLALLPCIFAENSPRKVFYPITLDQVGKFIDALDIDYDKISSPQGQRLALSIRGESGDYDVGIELFSDIQVLYIYVEKFMSLPLEEPSTVPMLTYLMNQNWRLTFGRLEWNISTGEVRLGHTLPIDDGLSAEVFGAYLSSIVSTADEKFPEYMITLENFTN